MGFSRQDADGFGGQMAFKGRPKRKQQAKRSQPEQLDDEPELLKSPRYFKPLPDPPQVVAYKYAADFARDIDLTPGCRYFAFVSGRFVFGDLLMALANMGKLSYKRLIIQNLSVNRGNIETIANLVDAMGGHMEQLDILLSDYWYAHYRRDLVPYLYEKIDTGKVPHLRIGFARTHSKVVAVESYRGNKVVMHGSANLRSSDNIENLAIEADDGLYDFVARSTDEILKRHNVINDGAVRHKSVQSEATWKAITESLT